MRNTLGTVDPEKQIEYVSTLPAYLGHDPDFREEMKFWTDYGRHSKLSLGSLFMDLAVLGKVPSPSWLLC
jgi:hypothetical protein